MWATGNTSQLSRLFGSPSRPTAATGGEIRCYCFVVDNLQHGGTKGFRWESFPTRLPTLSGVISQYIRRGEQTSWRITTSTSTPCEDADRSRANKMGKTPLALEN